MAKHWMTCVFESDVRDCDANPFHVDTPFGRPFHVGVGSAFDQLDAIEELVEGMTGGLADKIKDIIQGRLEKTSPMRDSQTEK